MFGAPAQPAAPVAQQPMAAGLGYGAHQMVGMVPPTADVLLAQQMAAVERQKKELAVLEAWRGGGGDGGGGGSSVTPASVFDRDVFGGARRSSSGGMDSNGGRRLPPSPSSSLMRYPPAPRSTAKIRPRGFAPMRSPSTGSTGAMTIGGGRRTAGRSPMMSPDRFLGSSAKHLVIKPGALTPKPKTQLMLTNDDAIPPREEEKTAELHNTVNGGGVVEKGDATFMSPNIRTPMMHQHGERKEDHTSNGTTPLNNSSGSMEQQRVGVQTPNTIHMDSPPEAKNNEPLLSPSPSSGGTTPNGMNITSPAATKNNGLLSSPSPTSGKEKVTTPNTEAYDYYRMVVGSPEPVQESMTDQNGRSNNNNGRPSNSAAPKLTKSGYTITPSLPILSSMSEADLAAVQGFRVERAGYGSIAWDGAVDIRGIDLDSVICIEHKEVAVYDNEEAAATKPSVGSKLNRPAVVTICDIFPKTGGASASVEDKKQFAKKLEKTTKKMSADLLSYDGEDGLWTFRVHHFSRYGLDDDDDNDGDKENDRGSGSKENGKGKDKIEASTEDMITESPSGLRAQGVLTLTSPTARTSRFSASFIDDEVMSESTTEEESASVTLMSDVDEQVIEAADNAYAIITQSIQSGKAPSMASNPMEVERRDIYFQDEGYMASEYTSAEVIPPPVPLASSSSSSSKGAVGISALIARRCGVKTATSSSTDFGMRMGRSFRVGWRPDGTLVHPGSFSKSQCHQNKTLIQSRPALIEKDLLPREKKEEMCTELLSVHLKHCQRLSSADDGCPFFSLHPDTSANDDETLPNQLTSILDGYTKEMNARTVTASGNYITKLTVQVFSLISILFKSTPDKPQNNFRRKEAFTKWLQQICSDDVERDIAIANSKNDPLGAIFAALSGNDIFMAESISSENGLHMLSSLLTNPDPQACTDLMQQMQAWEESGASSFCPGMLLRIFALLSRNLDLEEAMYEDVADMEDGLVLDWKRRLGMLLRSEDGNPAQSGDSTISSLLSQYESDVAKALAPPPYAWYLDANEPTYEKCILYRLIELFATHGGQENIMSLVDVISPGGHTVHQHDVSKSFHFASALSALEVCQPMTRAQEGHLLETYAFQLVEANVWEWAVYVLLCTFGDVDSIDRGMLQRRKSMAKDIVLRHYNTNNHDVDLLPNEQGLQQQLQRRSFLEQEVGIPSSWFEMALSHRYRRTFDPHGFVQQTAHFSLVDALATYEEILPDIIIDGKQTTDHKGVIEFLEAIKSDTRNEWDDSCLGGMVYDFLMLSQNVNEVSTITAMDMQPDITATEQRIDKLLVQAKRLQTTLCRAAAIATTTKKTTQPASLFFGGMTITSSEMCLAELTSAVSAMVVHLNIFRMGGSPFEMTSARHNNPQRLRKGGRKLKKTSELMFAWSNQTRDVSSPAQLNLKGVLGSRTILRGRYGLA